MKATGVVRRIDDLGRIVIPKEIRRTLHIKEGDPLEIFTDKEGEIIEGTPKTRTSFPNAWVNIMYGCNNFCSYCHYSIRTKHIC